MRRLTVSTRACTETLALLIAMAWADGKIEEKEKAGLTRAVRDLNLSKDQRGRLEEALAAPLPVDQLLFDELPQKEREFAFVAASWMAGVDLHRDPKEEALLEKVGLLLDIPKDRRERLDHVAKDLGVAAEADSEFVALLKAIPPHLEDNGEVDGDVEVVFD